jgi:hypothetical protein
MGRGVAWPGPTRAGLGAADSCVANMSGVRWVERSQLLCGSGRLLRGAARRGKCDLGEERRS